MRECTDEDELLLGCLFLFLLGTGFFLTVYVYQSVAATTKCNRSK